MQKTPVALVWLLLIVGTAMAQLSEPALPIPVMNAEQQRDHVDSTFSGGQATPTVTDAGQKELSTKHEAKNDERSPLATKEVSENWMVGGRALKITDTLLVGFTFLLFLATVGLFWATRDLVTGADKNAERQLRAYVFVKDGAVEITPDGGGFAFSMILKNFGPTPGYQYSTWLGGGIYPIDDVPFPKEAKPLSERVNGSIIGPTAETPVIAQSVALSPDDLQAIRNKTKAIFIWGGVDYIDAFDKPRHFIFKMRMTGPESQLRQGVHGWALTPHPLGYEAN